MTIRTTRRDADMVHCPACKTAWVGGAGMAYLTRNIGRDMCSNRLALHHRSTHRSAGMAARTTRRNAGVVHRPCSKGSGVGVASLACCRCGNMAHRFGHHRRPLECLSPMAARTTRRYAGVAHCPVGSCKATGAGAGRRMT